MSMLAAIASLTVLEGKASRNRFSFRKNVGFGSKGGFKANRRAELKASARRLCGHR